MLVKKIHFPRKIPDNMEQNFTVCNYRKVASSRLSRLVAHLRIFKQFMKGKFDAYVL